jgi:hypothetical protein
MQEKVNQIAARMVSFLSHYGLFARNADSHYSTGIIRQVQGVRQPTEQELQVFLLMSK